MDMSKLPRMSQTPPPPPEPGNPSAAGAPPRDVAAAPAQNVYRQDLDYGTEAAPSFAEAWISIAIGLILLFATYALRLIQFLLSPSTFTWNFSDEKGQPIKYTQTVFIWGDAAMLLFALVLIIDGLLLFTRKPALIALAFGLTALTVATNLFYLMMMMSRGYGFQIGSAIAVAFGVYIAIFQWKLLQSLRMTRAAALR